jgi:hypothetical protein
MDMVRGCRISVDDLKFWNDKFIEIHTFGSSEKYFKKMQNCCIVSRRTFTKNSVMQAKNTETAGPYEGAQREFTQENCATSAPEEK